MIYFRDPTYSVIDESNQTFIQRYRRLISTIAVLTLIVFAIVLFAIIIVIIVKRNNYTKPIASVLVLDSKVWTGDDKNPWVEAFAVIDNKIVELGDSVTIESKYQKHENTLVIRGNHTNMVLPGFIDSHIHLIPGGLHLSGVQLRDVTSKQQFIDRVRDYAANYPAGHWIQGGDWNHENWGGIVPDKSWIDEYTLSNPAFLNRLDGHMVLCNSVSLALANITRNTLNPSGGEIVKDESGEPTGILKDNAISLVEDFIKLSPDEEEKAAEKGMDYVVSKGVTFVVSVGSWTEWDILKRVQHKQKQILRVYHATPLVEWEKMAEYVKQNGRGDEWLSTGALKGFCDGSLGSETCM
jgi:predicted amidohydrolase YtcJ